MGYGQLSMSQVRKVTRAGISATSRHNMREDLEKWSTEHVDKDRTRYNVTLIGTNTEDDIIDDITGCDMRHSCAKNPQKDVIAAEFILAPSSEWLGHLLNTDQLSTLTPDACDKLLKNERFLKWMIEATEALKAERCISATLHMDEKTPHIHCICSVKMKRESKAKSEKSKRRSKKSEYVLSYSNYYGTRGEDYKLATSSGEKRAALEKKYGRKYDSTQTPLGLLQTRIWERIGKPFGMDRGVAASETGIKGDSVKEWRVRQAKEKADEEAAQRIRQYQEEVEKKVAAKKSEMQDEAKAEIISYNNDMKLEIQKKKDLIDRDSEKDIEEYREQKKKEEEAEKIKLKIHRDQLTEILLEEKKEFDNAMEKLIKETQNNKALANKMILLRNNENIRIQSAIKKLEDQYSKKIKAATILIESSIKSITKTASILGYTTDSFNFLSNLMLTKKQLMADARTKTGRQILAFKNKTNKLIESAIDEMKNFESQTNFYETLHIQ